MSKQNAPQMLNELPAFDKDGKTVRVIIETPKGSRSKFDYDPEIGAFELAMVLPEGQLFPYDFGFIPSTKAEDGDPIDVLVLMDEPVMTGCLLKARLIGVIEAEQTEKGKTNRNDRLLAVCTQSQNHQHVYSLDHLRPGQVDEIERFFVHYNESRNKQFKPLRRGGPDRALELVQEAGKKA